VRVVVVVVALGVLVAGVVLVVGAVGRSPRTTSSVSGSGGSALAALSAIAVKGRAPMTGYSREQFGNGWVDTDHNGCDTRNDVLARDLTQPTFKAGTHDCVVAAGTLADPYTGTTIDFVRGGGTSVDIDHVVALGDAWQTGAATWTAARRLDYANDPGVLLAVDGPANEAKGDSDAGHWLPPRKTFDCRYAARQIAIKTKYDLWLTQPEHDAMSTLLAGC
jgi:hypothetical protein